MDPITTAIVGALAAGALSGLTSIGETALADAYTYLKTLLHRKFGTRSGVMQALGQLEQKPTSPNRQGVLHEELAAVNAGRDAEISAAVTRLQTVGRQHQSISVRHVSVGGNINQVGGNQYQIGRDQLNVNAGDLVGPGPRRTARTVIAMLLIVFGLITAIPALGIMPFFDAIVRGITQPIQGFPDAPPSFNDAANRVGTAAHVIIDTMVAFGIVMVIVGLLMLRRKRRP